MERDAAVLSRPVVCSHPGSPLARHFDEIAGRFAQRVAIRAHQELPILQ